jgi:hypothetical protein
VASSGGTSHPQLEGSSHEGPSHAQLTERSALLKAHIQAAVRFALHIELRRELSARARALDWLAESPSALQVGRLARGWRGAAAAGQRRRAARGVRKARAGC